VNLDLNLKHLVSHMILFVLAEFLKPVRCDGDSKPLDHPLYFPRRFWNARLVEQGKPAPSYIRYTMRHVRTLSISVRYVAIIGPAIIYCGWSLSCTHVRTYSGIRIFAHTNVCAYVRNYMWEYVVYVRTCAYVWRLENATEFTVRVMTMSQDRSIRPSWSIAR